MVIEREMCTYMLPTLPAAPAAAAPTRRADAPAVQLQLLQHAFASARGCPDMAALHLRLSE